MKHNTHIGDETMIETLEKKGKLGEKVPGGPDFTDSVSKVGTAALVAKTSESKM
jgi:hypothetical protein